MASNPRNFPFYNWVPKPLGIIFLIILFIPIMTISGVYSVNSSEMIGGLGIQSEHISFVGFVTSVGMAAFSPFFYDLVCLRRQKMMSVVGFSILFALSYVCAKTDSIFLLAVCSLIMGFVRQTLLMTTLFTLIKYGFHIEATRNLTPGNEPTTEEGWDKLDTEKTTSMPTIYFFFMILGQMGTWLTAYLAYAYEWQYVYYFMMAAMLVAIVISMVAMPYHKYPMKKFPINFSKFGNVVVFSMMCCSFIFIMVYGKVLDWYSHPYIRMATIVCVVFTLLFVYLEYTRRSPYFLLSTLKLRSVQGGILLFLGLMIFNSSAMFVNVFVSVGMKIDNWQNATLGNWVLVGYFLGLVMAVICSAKGFHLKWLFALGFILIGLSALYMYFEVQDAGMYGRMKWPVIIRATGMMLLYALTAVYANQRMPYRYMSTWVCIMLTVRMIIGPGIGSALYSNVLQERQQHYVTRFAQDFDRMDSQVAADYQRTVQGMMYQGRSETEAQQMAAMSLKGKVQVQATLTAIKEMAGWTFYGCVICAGVILLVPWRKKPLEKVLADIKPKYLSRNKAV
ncbi:MAG: MFS transporter [Prevotella sp.]